MDTHSFLMYKVCRMLSLNECLFLCRKAVLVFDSHEWGVFSKNNEKRKGSSILKRCVPRRSSSSKVLDRIFTINSVPSYSLPRSYARRIICPDS